MATGGYARPESLVSTAWVARHTRDPQIRLVEVDVDTTAYGTGHIPGAVGWNWQADLQRHPMRDIPSPEEWEALLSRSGIGNDLRVVLYGDNANWFAAFALWLFELYGHRRVALMNGGRQKWIAEQRRLTQDAPSVAPATYHVEAADLAVRATRDDVAAAISEGRTVLVDVRSAKEFSGELLAPANLPQEAAQRGGHLPGALNVPWQTCIAADGTFKSRRDLRQLYGGTDQPMITYSRIGERSALTWFALTHLLGHQHVRNYDGSWAEWGSLIGVPIELSPPDA